MKNHDVGEADYRAAEFDNRMREACGDYVIVDYRGYEVFQTPTFTVALDKMVQRKRDGYGPDSLHNLARAESDPNACIHYVGKPEGRGYAFRISGFGITDDEARAMEDAGI